MELACSYIKKSQLTELYPYLTKNKDLNALFQFVNDKFIKLAQCNPYGGQY